MGCSGTSRKTRIETYLLIKFSTFFFILVAVELPEKQGLKLVYLILKPLWFFRCSGTSRKTRIETINTN